MAAKKKVAKKTAVKAAPRPKAIADKQTKTQIIANIADSTGLSKKDVAAVFGALGDLVHGHVRKGGSGEIAIPDTGIKVRRVVKPARKARMGRNPATGEMIKIPAKRASTAVKVTALKALKEMIA